MKDKKTADFSVFFSEAKKALSTEKPVVYYSTTTNAHAIRTIQSLKTRKAALLGELKVLEMEVPRSDRKNTSSMNRRSSTSNTHIRNAALMEVVNRLNLQYYSTSLSAKECANSIAFDEPMEFMFFYVTNTSVSIHIRRMSSVCHVISSSPDVVLGTPWLQLEHFEKSSGSREAHSIFYIPTFSIQLDRNICLL